VVSSLDLTEHPDKADKLSDGFLSHLEEPTLENLDHSGECLPSIVPALLQITLSVHSQALVWPENTWACCPGALSPLSQDYYDKYWVDVCCTLIPSQNRMQFPPTISLKNSQCFTQERSMINHRASLLYYSLYYNRIACRRLHPLSRCSPHPQEHVCSISNKLQPAQSVILQLIPPSISYYHSSR
jgi:hypothetical protein